MKSPTLIKKITSLIQDKKGYDIKIIDLKGISSLTDFFIIFPNIFFYSDKSNI